jgi:hypothetical protein
MDAGGRASSAIPPFMPLAAPPPSVSSSDFSLSVFSDVFFFFFFFGFGGSFTGGSPGVPAGAPVDAGVGDPDPPAGSARFPGSLAADDGDSAALGAAGDDAPPLDGTGPPSPDATPDVARSRAPLSACPARGSIVPTSEPFVTASARAFPGSGEVGAETLGGNGFVVAARPKGAAGVRLLTSAVVGLALLDSAPWAPMRFPIALGPIEIGDCAPGAITTVAFKLVAGTAPTMK